MTLLRIHSAGSRLSKVSLGVSEGGGARMLMLQRRRVVDWRHCGDLNTNVHERARAGPNRQPSTPCVCTHSRPDSVACGVVLLAACLNTRARGDRPGKVAPSFKVDMLGEVVRLVLRRDWPGKVAPFRVCQCSKVALCEPRRFEVTHTATL